MHTLKGTEVSLSYVQCFFYLVSSSINISIFHITWLDTFWPDLIHSLAGREATNALGSPKVKCMRYMETSVVLESLGLTSCL